MCRHRRHPARLLRIYRGGVSRSVRCCLAMASWGFGGAIVWSGGSVLGALRCRMGLRTLRNRSGDSSDSRNMEANRRQDLEGLKRDKFAEAQGSERRTTCSGSSRSGRWRSNSCGSTPRCSARFPHGTPSSGAGGVRGPCADRHGRSRVYPQEHAIRRIDEISRMDLRPVGARQHRIGLHQGGGIKSADRNGRWLPDRFHGSTGSCTGLGRRHIQRRRRTLATPRTSQGEQRCSEGASSRPRCACRYWLGSGRGRGVGVGPLSLRVLWHNACRVHSP